MKIWQRYFYKSIFINFLFFIIVFYGLYIIIDYSSKSSNFHYGHSHFKLFDILKFYLLDFVEKAEVLVPFGLLIATIRVTTDLNVHNELIALMASGLRLKKLLSPFIFTGILMMGLMYINTEYFYPLATKSLNKIDESHRSKKNKHLEVLPVQSVLLKNNTSLLFQHYDSEQKILLDTYYIASIDEIYRIKKLRPYEKPAVGETVDQFLRDKEGHLRFVKAYDTLTFPDMQFAKKDIFQNMLNAEDYSLRELYKKLPKKSVIESEKESQILSYFYRKLSMPWLTLFAVLAPLPLCVRFSRHIPLFFIYAISIFMLLAIYLIADATLILGKRQILDPAIAILSPFILLLSIFSYRFLKL